jgi:hypothetical protein
VLYDSRTWHRRPDELNVSGEARVNVLLAFSHKWMRPMIPYGDEAAKLRGGGALLGSLTRRERDCALLLFGGPDDGGDDDVGIEEAGLAGSDADDGADDDVSIEEVDLAGSDSDDSAPD